MSSTNVFDQYQNSIPVRYLPDTHKIFYISFCNFIAKDPSDRNTGWGEVINMNWA
jgi:hypothetical protein